MQTLAPGLSRTSLDFHCEEEQVSKHAPQHHAGFQFWKVHRVCKIVQDTSDVL
jgi:hypothetical protein